MSPFIKLGIGAVLLGVGFVVSMKGQRELIAKWASPCEDCEGDEGAASVVKEKVDHREICKTCGGRVGDQSSGTGCNCAIEVNE